MQQFDIAIVGAGVMGAAAACELAEHGARVALIDQSLIPNPRAASIDHSKVFRLAYPDPFYVKLAVDSLELWRQLESATGVKLLTETGALLIGRHELSFATECYRAMEMAGVHAERLDDRQVAGRFPQFNSKSFAYGVYDPSGAILHAEDAVLALAALALQRGATILENKRVVAFKQDGGGISIITDSGSGIRCERALIASGPWSRKLLAVLERNLTTTRQELVYFDATAGGADRPDLDFAPAKFPIFLELDSGFYGFPIHPHGSMKIANHHKGPEVDPDLIQEPVSGQFIATCRSFFSEFIPGLATATVTETRVCLYNNTPDDDFIVDWHPELKGVLMATGFSGHGFKFGPLIGRIAADLLTSGATSSDINRFRLSRFHNKEGVPI